MTRVVMTALAFMRRGSIRLLFLAAAIPLAVLVAIALADRSPSESDPTSRYLAELDVARFERNGTRYTDPELSPYRNLPKLTIHDQTYHYDFARLASVENRLRGVNRRQALRAIFDRVTAGAPTNRDRHLAILRFLHRASFHNLIQPMYTDGTSVSDPLVLLELGEMRCGHVNRVAVDLFQSMGYRGRLVQAAFHILAEIWYDGAWHYFDGDIFGDGECVVMGDGHIPSMNELAECPECLDTLTSYWEPDHTNSIRGPTPYPSWYYFGAGAYRRSNAIPSHIEKLAAPGLEDKSRYYGWEVELTVPDTERRIRENLEERFTPGPPRIVALDCRDEPECRRVTLQWQRDPAAAGYRVHVGNTSRGWNYSGPSLPSELLKWKSSGGAWKPEMYSARFRMPPSDLLMRETTDADITVRLPPQSTAYVTVMAFDAYGKSVGRRLYPMSEELRLP